MTDQKYKLVPLTLTPEMGHTGDALIDADYSMQGIWDGMLEVAPEPVCKFPSDDEIREFLWACQAGLIADIDDLLPLAREIIARFGKKMEVVSDE